MYYIIETVEQLRKLPKTDKCYINLVPSSEETHPILTAPCVLYYNDFQKGYILPINHPEGFSLSIEEVQILLFDIEKVYLVDKKKHSYFLYLPQAIDLCFNILDSNGEIKDVKCDTPIHSDFYNKFKYFEKTNELIPISKHYERCECIFENLKKYCGKEGNVDWQNRYVEAYKWVEEQGLTLNEKVFDKFFEPTWKARSVKDNRIFTSYNLFNITSRPTNAFNGINFLAFNKENGSRSAFIPENDTFIEFDFDGYHVRLIANMLDLKIPTDDSVHMILGKQYFGKEELTPEEYQESKKITFRQLYNGIESEFKHIELFSSIDELIQATWLEYKKQGYLRLPNGREIVMENANPQKLFNYYVQCLETVNNTKKLIALKELFKGKKSKVVLVVYDSILIDYSAEDGKGFLKQIKDLLEEEGYRVKAKKGDNYNF